MFLLLTLEVDTGPFRFLPILILPVIAIAIIAFGIYLARHRGRKRS